jgi:hypothetical protein
MVFEPKQGICIMTWRLYKKDLDEWLNFYNNEQTHQGKMCYGRTNTHGNLTGWQNRLE